MIIALDAAFNLIRRLAVASFDCAGIRDQVNDCANMAGGYNNKDRAMKWKCTMLLLLHTLLPETRNQ